MRHIKTSHVTTFYRLSASLIGLLTVASCTVIEAPSGGYRPTRHQTTRPAPTKKPGRVAVTPKPTKKPTVSKPKPSKPIKTVLVKPHVDEPEQGANPYDDVPQRASSRVEKPTTTSNTSSSPAVQGLIKKAKVSMAVKRNKDAINTLERALRIEPRNPAIWYQLGKANYNEGNDATAISMARKSNLYTAEDSPLEKLNWQLIKSASKRSGNIKILKEAIRYGQTHP